jgi:hypothetical protein
VTGRISILRRNSTTGASSDSSRSTDFDDYDDCDTWREELADRSASPIVDTEETRWYVNTLWEIENSDTVDNTRSLYTDIAEGQSANQFLNTLFEAKRTLDYAKQSDVSAIERDAVLPGTDKDVDLRLTCDGGTEFVENKRIRVQLKEGNLRDTIVEETNPKFAESSLDGTDGTRIAEIKIEKYTLRGNSPRQITDRDELESALDELASNNDLSIDTLRIEFPDGIVREYRVTDDGVSLSGSGPMSRTAQTGSVAVAR